MNDRALNALMSDEFKIGAEAGIAIVTIGAGAEASTTSAAGGDIYADLRRTFEERLHLLPVYRRKLATVPLDLDNPYWVDDPDLDLEFHIRELALPAPGDPRQLAEQISRIVARPLLPFSLMACIQACSGNPCNKYRNDFTIQA